MASALAYLLKLDWFAKKRELFIGHVQIKKNMRVKFVAKASPSLRGTKQTPKERGIVFAVVYFD